MRHVYSITVDDGPRLPIYEVTFYSAQDAFLDTTPETIRVFMSHGTEVGLGSMRLRLNRGEQTLLDTTANLVAVSYAQPGDTMMEFNLDVESPLNVLAAAVEEHERPCRECAQLEWVALEYIGVWAGHPRWWEPSWRTRRRIDHAMKVREQMNEAYASGMCQGLGHQEREQT